MEKFSVYYRYLVLAVFIAVITAGCIFSTGDTIDITPPEIELIKPIKWQHLPAGDFVEFEATFMDDLELGSYSIDIHDNLEGHGHGRLAQSSNDPDLIRWSFKSNYSIPEGYIMYVAQHNDDIEVSANALAGPYHFIVQAVDREGNATNFQDGSNIEVEVLITNDSQPVVDITNLVEDELQIEAGVVFMVEGSISDPTVGQYAGIHSLEVVLGEDLEGEHDHVHGRTGEEDHEYLIDMDYEGGTLYAFMIDEVIQLDLVFTSINFTLSQETFDELTTEDVDHLILTLKVRDEQGNLTISRTIVHIIVV